ncbi:mobilization protein, partial [Campylobacter jejuni]|nr:mobilization protein [Campylobacter jejuni]
KGKKTMKVEKKRDEVREKAKGEKQTNKHENEVLYTLDKNGLQLARREESMNKANIRKIQTLTEQSIKMERGAKRYENNEKQPQYIQD